MRFDKPISLIKAREPFPMLQHLVEPETGCSQRRRDVAIEGGGEGQHDRLFAFVALTRLAREGASTQRGPVLDLFLVPGTIAQ